MEMNIEMDSLNFSKSQGMNTTELCEAPPSLSGRQQAVKSAAYIMIEVETIGVGPVSPRTWKSVKHCIQVWFHILKSTIA